MPADIFIKAVGPMAIFAAGYLLYKKMMYCPSPFSKPIFPREHLLRVENGNPIKTQNLPSGMNGRNLYVKVLTYNILADCYSHYFMFKYVSHSYLKFGYRSHRILHEIQQSNSDIICLQEVDHINDFYKPRLEEMGYELQYTLRREKDAVLVGYKREQFILIKSEPVDYDEVAELLEDKSLRLHNKAIICLLQHRESKKYFIAISSHLYWGQDSVRSAQILYLLRCLSKFVEDQSVVPADQQISIIACGDFNSGINKPAIKMMYGDRLHTQSKDDDSNLTSKDDLIVKPIDSNNKKEQELYRKIFLEYDKLDPKLKNKFKFQSAYQNYFLSDNDECRINQSNDCRLKGHPKHTNFTGKYKDHFDYIFHTSNLKVESLLEVPSLDILTKETALPSSIFPSDHLRMEAIFSMKL